MHEQSIWLWPLTILGTGLVAGVVMVLWLYKTRRQTVYVNAYGRIDDLQEQADGFINQLRELNERQASMPEDFVKVEREALELRAASTLKALALAKKPTSKRATKSVGDADSDRAVRFLQRHPQLKGALWGSLVASVAMFLLVKAQQEGTPTPPMGSSVTQVGTDGLDTEELESLKVHLQKMPNDATALLRLAHILLRGQLLEEAEIVNTRALRLVPNDLEGLTHAAVLAAAHDNPEAADVGLNKVLATDPGFIEAWFFRGMLAMQKGDMTTMQQSLIQYVRLAPDGPQKQRIRNMLERSRAGNLPGG